MNKRGLRAFSFGILFAVSVLGAYYYFLEQKDHRPISSENAKKTLSNEGYVILSADEYKKLKQQTKQQPPQPAKQQQTKAEADQQNATKQTAYQLVVTSGMSSGEIAKILAEQHIIENENEFARYLTSHNYQTKIQIGTYSLSNTMDYEQIAKKITNTK